MPKIRILQKGLLLVFVPMFVGITFILCLYQGLLSTDKMIRREMRLKDAATNFVRSNSCMTLSETFAQFYIATRGEIYRMEYNRLREESVQAYSAVKRDLKGEADLHVPPFDVQVNYLMVGTAGSTSPFLTQLQKMVNDQTGAALASVDSLYLTLYLGLSVCVFSSLILAVFFCLNITNRLLLIVNNTRNLSIGKALNAPLKGSDEIAELDQFLFDAAAKIQDLEKFKKEMIGVVSHELKSPLSSVGAFLTSLESGVFGEISEKGKMRAQRTFSNIKRLMGLLADLLYLDRLELEIKPEDLRVSELVSLAVDSVKELSEKSGIEIVVNSQDTTIFADRDRLVQVLVNLLSNALKFSPAGGHVLLETTSTNGYFECRVVDKGKGIPEEHRKKIFEPFQQVDAKDKTSKKGTGLGLTISRSIVEQHGGEIGVDSELGRGTSFWFKIPLSAAKTLPQASEASSALALSSIKESRNSRTGKFSVLQQGFLIISVPLVFQLAVAGVFGLSLQRVQKQVQKEEKSKEVIQISNDLTEFITNAAKYGFCYIYFKDDELFKQRWKEYVNKSYELMDRIAVLKKDDRKDVEYLRQARKLLAQISDEMEKEAATKVGQGVLKNLGGHKPFLGLMPQWAQHILAESKEPDIKKDEPPPQFNPIQALTYAFGTFTNASNNNFMFTCIELQKMQDKVMTREKASGEVLSRERKSMIISIQSILLAGVLVSIVLSTCLAVFIMRSFTTRLSHVMDNTARLLKREMLDAPKRGGDEIAYLDAMLYDAGNRLLQLEAFKKELVSIVSHELRTPLLSISSALELFDQGLLGELSEKGKNRLKFAQSETTRLIRLINDLLDIEKMEAGKFILDISEISVEELVEQAISSVAELAELKGIKLQTKYSQAGMSIEADSDRICQVLINFLSNAIKYSPEDSTVINSVEHNISQLMFSVEDRGRGIPEALKEKIFERFVQVEKTDATEKGGTGLGLAISRAIVEQHGGTIGVESATGVGSKFWFTLPAKGVKLI